MNDQPNRIYRHDFLSLPPCSEPLRLANDPPPWRSFAAKKDSTRPFTPREIPQSQAQRGMHFLATEDEARMVDAALVLRRPLLIEGDPGIGKSSLAYSVAWQLGLGSVFKWSITTRSCLKDALYQYDAIGRLQASSLNQSTGKKISKTISSIGDYLTLGPLGSVLIPNQTGPYHPRVLLIDEIDKSDIDLPNDLLHVLEEGSFDIPEIARLNLKEPIKIRLHSSKEEYEVPVDGKVVCDDFPLIILTTNGEREFSPAFKRRCLTIQMQRPDEAKLRQVIEMHLGSKWENDCSNALLLAFLQKIQSGNQIAVDQLLNAVYLTTSSVDVSPNQHSAIQQSVLRSLADLSDGA
jgi:MoxR-like ATPase